MGIPFYFSQITKNHPDIIQDRLDLHEVNIFLDFNCAIHYCNKLLKDDCNKNGVSHDSSDYESLLIQKCSAYVNDILEPLDVHSLFIAIDGVVPCAKMAQQRKRRYLSVFRNELIPSSSWDSNAISPGTQFMKKLNAQLHSHQFNAKNVIISDSTEPGEGETKIFNFIKSNNLQSKNVVVYGLDADLIMLSMLIENENTLFLMRESEFYQHGILSKFLYMNIPLLKSHLIHHIHSFKSNSRLQYPIQNYVTLCMLIGNDFIPTLSYLKIKNKSIDYLLHTLIKSISEDNVGELIYFDEGLSKWRINWIVFQRLLTDLANFEDDEFCKIHNNYYRTSKEFQSESDKIDFYGIFKKPRDSIFPNKDGWRLRYYSTLFRNSSIDDICKTYILGIKWNVEYYFNQKCFTEWFYKHEYSPTISDLNIFLTVTDPDKLYLPEGEHYVSEDVHLCSILPKQSHHLLCDTFRKKMCQLKYAKLFPVKYEIQTYLKHYLHDCSPLIPPLKMPL